MKLVIILFVSVSIVLCFEECKQRRNHLSYRISGAHEVVGVRRRVVQRVIKSVLDVWANTIEDLDFVKEPTYDENYELLFEFVSFTEKFKHTRFIDHVAFTVVNCTSSDYGLETIKTIHNSTMYFNTDYSFEYKSQDERRHVNKIDLFLTAMHEVGHALGLQDNENAKSIMFRLAHSLDVLQFNHTKIPDDDLVEINKLYVLKNQENVWKI